MPLIAAGVAVEGMHGMNMLLARLGFELLRAPFFDGWLKRILQVPYLHCCFIAFSLYGVVFNLPCSSS